MIWVANLHSFKYVDYVWLVLAYLGIWMFVYLFGNCHQTILHYMYRLQLPHHAICQSMDILKRDGGKLKKVIKWRNDMMTVSKEGKSCQFKSKIWILLAWIEIRSITIESKHSDFRTENIKTNHNWQFEGFNIVKT